jgi:nucleotide-binding universal stress UspA family protein
MSTHTSLTIVVGYDGSPASHAAVEHAIDRAAPDGHLVLVHTYSVPADYIGAPYYNSMLADGSQYAADLLDALERECERLGTVGYERDILTGAAAPAIVRAAEQHGADAIVVGSRGLGRVRSILGSVAHDVIHNARCAVTVIPERALEPTEEPPVAAAAAV